MDFIKWQMLYKTYKQIQKYELNHEYTVDNEYYTSQTLNFGNVLSEIRQAQKDKYCMISLP